MSEIGHNGGPPIIRGNDGWIAISRAIRAHWLVGFGQPVAPMDPTRGAHSRSEAFIDLLMECRYEAGTVNNGGRRMILQPGQLVGAISWLAARWNWTPKTVRGWLDKLQEDGMIDREIENQGKQAAVITVCNYSEYQLVQEQPGQAQGNQRAIKGQTKGNIYKDKQRNKGTKEQEETLPLIADAREERAIVNRRVAKTCFVKWQEFTKQVGLRTPRDSTYEVFGKKIATRLFEHAAPPKGEQEMMAVFDLALVNIGRSKFLRGMTTEFSADLKFLCQRESFAKIINGDYGNGAHAVTSTGEPEESEHERQLALIKAQRERERLEDGLS